MAVFTKSVISTLNENTFDRLYADSIEDMETKGNFDWIYVHEDPDSLSAEEKKTLFRALWDVLATRGDRSFIYESKKNGYVVSYYLCTLKYYGHWKAHDPRDRAKDDDGNLITPYRKVLTRLLAVIGNDETGSKSWSYDPDYIQSNKDFYAEHGFTHVEASTEMAGTGMADHLDKRMSDPAYSRGEDVDPSSVVEQNAGSRVPGAEGKLERIYSFELPDVEPDSDPDPEAE
tara:strand:- start:720 stop:1412 length:693 start_codon:yes stop_codon:yes gene_type:complete